MPGLGNDLKRQDFDLSAGDELRLLGVARKELPALKCLDGVLICRGGEMIVVGTAANLHAAIRDFSAQRRIMVQRRDEPGDVLMPLFLRAVFQAILDEKVFHVQLLRGHAAFIWEVNELISKYGQK